ncbi:unnamed protein product [Paramecium pentaurelia]|uniref:Uncharacterized protein n=1 Tax=Paramecium pentaurelia TaxID=43138 RepID=A0A8S1WWI4_9CILI|nr:unnamed protein product [Paramecium pentaurelia]
MNSKSTNINKGNYLQNIRNMGQLNKVLKKGIVKVDENWKKIKSNQGVLLGGSNFLNKIYLDESKKLLTMAQNILFKNQEFLIFKHIYITQNKNLKGVIYKLVEIRIQLKIIILMLKSKGRAWKSNTLVLLHWLYQLLIEGNLSECAFNYVIKRMKAQLNENKQKILKENIQNINDDIEVKSVIRLDSIFKQIFLYSNLDLKYTGLQYNQLIQGIILSQQIQNELTYQWCNIDNNIMTCPSVYIGSIIMYINP